jgi:Asp-tRNA(Asn)/Glu-tRNA(Gln) amidotransferase C subunit
MKRSYEDLSMHWQGSTTRLEEMEDTPRSVPGLRQTIDTILGVVRQSREAEGAPQAATADAAELMRMVRDDIAAARADAHPQQGPGLSPEDQEAADLARIRRALYDA